MNKVTREHAAELLSVKKDDLKGYDYVWTNANAHTPARFWKYAAFTLIEFQAAQRSPKFHEAEWSQII